MNSNAFFIFPCFTNEQIKEINKNIKKNILQKEASDAPAGDRTKIGDFFEVPVTPLMELLHPWLHQWCDESHSGTRLGNPDRHLPQGAAASPATQGLRPGGRAPHQRAGPSGLAVREDQGRGHQAGALGAVPVWTE